MGEFPPESPEAVSADDDPHQHEADDSGYEHRRLLDDPALEDAERDRPPQAPRDRLNHPPVFDISNPTVSPDQIEAGVRTDATARFEVHNTGDGSGTFGASFSGNLASGSATATATIDRGAHREVSTSTPITGKGEAATVQLDWGTDEWSTDIPVVGTMTSPESPTGTPHPQ